jgi:hypothetical protein
MDKAEKIIEGLEEEICGILKKQPLGEKDVEILSKLTCSLKDVSTSSGMGKYADQYLDGVSMAALRNMSEDMSTRRWRSPMTGQFISHDEWPNTGGNSNGMYNGSFGNPNGSYNDSYGNLQGSNRAYAAGYSGHSINDRMISSL